jgi:hypothetical protein
VSHRQLATALLCALTAPALSAQAQPAPGNAPPSPTDSADLSQRLESQQADINEQDARIKGLEKQLKSLREALEEQANKPAPPAAPSTSPSAPPAPSSAPQLPASPRPSPAEILPEFLRGLVISSFIQAQYEGHQDSEDQLRPGGALQNQDRFLIRRARLRLEKDWEYARLMAELDGNTVQGPAFGLQHAEASLLFRGGKPLSAPPMVGFTLGIFDAPFGAELMENPKARFFMERSLISRAFFPAESDLGARLSTSLGWFRAAVGVMNGEPLNERSGFGLREPNNAKDITARVGVDLGLTDRVTLVGGVSVLNGKGFQPGTDATKGSVVWRDTNENGQIDAGELTVLPAVSALPSMNFNRWALGADLALAMRTSIGWTRLTGEVIVASNMDRGLFVANPIITAIDAREMGFVVGVTQELTPYGVVGFRFDSYDPNADAQDMQGGKFVPTSQVIRTFSSVVGLTLPDRARLLFQYDVQRDFLGRNPAGIPADLKNDAWTLRLQVRL